MKVTRIANKPILSNCYVLRPEEKDSPCIVIDPGTIDNGEVLAFLSDSQLYPEIVLLTHEHFDHCAGVDALAKHYNFRLIASEQTANRITNSKTNFSAYYEAIEPFELLTPVEVVKDGEVIEFENHKIECLETPGHSPGSMCYIVGNFVFTGDTLLNGTKTPLKLPGSDKIQHQASIKKLQSVINQGTIVYPGHGQPFRIQGS